MNRNLKVCIKSLGIYYGTLFYFSKFIIFPTRLIFNITGRKLEFMALILKNLNLLQNKLIQSYIYRKYRPIYDKYVIKKLNSITPSKKVIWTFWAQGINENTPEIIIKSIKTIQQFGEKSGYDVNVLDLENIKKFIEISPEIYHLLEQGKIKHAHFADLVRVKLLAKHSGVWLDAGAYLIKNIPDSIWDKELVVWNKVNDLSGKFKFSDLPVTELFNNGFLVAKEDSYFYKFAEEITENLLFDGVLSIEYFSIFHAYLIGKKKFDWLNILWEGMTPINTNGLVVRQLWNQPITPEIKKILDGNENDWFFILTYKNEWIDNISGVDTVQEYLTRKEF